MSDIILIYPRSSYIETAMKTQYLPLCLLQAAIFVEKEFKVKIIDQRITKFWKEEIKKELNQKTLCVGITALTGEMLHNALEISQFVREISNVQIVWGGVHPTILPEQTLKNDNIDMLVIGEGEITFLELARALRDGLDLGKIKGLAFKRDRKIKINEYRELVDLNDLPDPPYHLVNIENYILKFDNKRMFTVETSRGCPYKCAFCYSTSFGFRKKWRALSAERTIKKIKSIKKNLNIEGIEIIDDNFLVDSKRTKTILNTVIKEKMDIFLNINGRINDVLRLDNGNMEILEQSNVRRLATGVESGSQRIRDMIGKDINEEEILEFKELIDKTKISPYYNFIGGFFSETEGDLRESVRLMLKLLKGNNRAKVSIFHCFRPLPGTKLIDECEKSGFEFPDNLEEWSKYSMAYIDHPWLTYNMKKKIKMLSFVSLFLDRKYEEVDSLAVTIFANLYRPIAYFRLKALNTKFFIESHLLKLYEKIKR